MCRMLGIFPKSEQPIDFSLVRSFRKLASCGNVGPGAEPGHMDGWGIVSWKNSIPTYLGREPTDAFVDPKFEEACILGEKSELSAPLLAHLRKASVGHKTLANTHPFVLENWAFAHNGTIRRLNLRYTTDSEWFFRSIMKETEIRDGDVVRAIANQVAAVRSSYPYTSITFIMSSNKKMYAYRDATIHPNYYTIFLTETNNSYVFSQEKFFDANWRELGLGELLVVDENGFRDAVNISEIIDASNKSVIV